MKYTIFYILEKFKRWSGSKKQKESISTKEILIKCPPSERLPKENVAALPLSDKSKQGKKELDTLKSMVVNWKTSYLLLFDGTDGWGFLADDLKKEISMHIFPYMKRLKHSEYIDNTDISKFVFWCEEEVEDLRIKLKL